MDQDGNQPSWKCGKRLRSFYIINAIGVLLVVGFILIPNLSCKKSDEPEKAPVRTEPDSTIIDPDRSNNVKAPEVNVEEGKIIEETAAEEILSPPVVSEERPEQAIDFKHPGPTDVADDSIIATESEKEAYDKAISDPNKAIEQENQDGITAAKAWLELIDNREYGKSWEEAASLFKAALSQRKWKKVIGKINKHLGKVINREFISQTPIKIRSGELEGDFVKIQFRSEFEKEKGVMETITLMLEKDSQWRAGGYGINKE